MHYLIEIKSQNYEETEGKSPEDYFPQKIFCEICNDDETVCCHDKIKLFLTVS